MSSSFTNAIVLGLMAASSAMAMPTTPSKVSVLPEFNGLKTGPVAPLSTALVPGIVANMKTAATNVAKFKALLFGEDKETPLEGEALRQRVIFDFIEANKPIAGNSTATGGTIVGANVGTFPILADSGVSIALGFLGPCGLNTPHTHPRATEFLTLVDGDILESGFILENNFVDADGLPLETRSTIKKLQGTVFPKGSNHWQFNPTCKPATFVAALSSEDPGVSQIAQNFFNLEGDVVEATLGFPEQISGDKLAQFKSMIPANAAQIVEQCAKECGYAY